MADPNLTAHAITSELKIGKVPGNPISTKSTAVFGSDV